MGTEQRTSDSIGIYLHLPLSVLLQSFRHRLVRRGALWVVELALVPVGALLAVGAGGRGVAAFRAVTQEVVQGGSRAAERVLRRHEPGTTEHTRSVSGLTLA